MKIALALALVMMAPTAHASCSSIADKAGTINGDAVGGTFAQLAQCDAKLAEDRFPDFMRASTDVGSLVGLSLAAIDTGVYAPVWGLLEKVPEISTRDEVAKGVGASCNDHAKVNDFLKGAYTQMHDRQFGMWRDAYRNCKSEELGSWLVEVVAQPPAVSYDEKYNVVTAALVKSQGAASLPVFGDAAIAAAANGGPFTTLLDRMNEVVRPATYGGVIAPEDQAALQETLSKVAAAVGQEQASLVANRLYQSGAEEAAVALLPVIYADRIQGKADLLYGAAAVESCDGEAIVHFALVIEPSSRWSIVDDVTLALRAFKPKLKCTAEGDWPVMTSHEPLVDKAALEGWVAEVEGQWSGRDLAVKSREEKGITLGS